jgi:hypothetical protein
VIRFAGEFLSLFEAYYWPLFLLTMAIYFPTQRERERGERGERERETSSTFWVSSPLIIQQSYQRFLEGQRDREVRREMDGDKPDVAQGAKAVSLEDLRKKMAEFARERDWEQFHSPRNLLLALVAFSNIPSFLVFLSYFIK